MKETLFKYCKDYLNLTFSNIFCFLILSYFHFQMSAAENNLIAGNGVVEVPANSDNETSVEQQYEPEKS